MSTTRGAPTRWELRQIASVALYLYGIDVSPLLHHGTVEVERSPRTGRIRHVFLDGKLVLTLRSSDGFLLITPLGWTLLKEKARLAHVVEASPEAARFVMQGRSLFSKHVAGADRDILPGDEVCIVSHTDGSILAVGKAVLPGEDMGLIKKGKAVKVRRGLEGAS